MPARWQDVAPTEAEVAEVVAKATAAAVDQLKQAQYQAAKNNAYAWDCANPRQAMQLNLDDVKRRFMQYARAGISADYATDSGTAEVLNILAHYFAGHPGFEAMGEGYSLEKGIYLVGTVGVGKTSIMRIFGQLNARQKFGVVSTAAVHAEYTANGAAGLLVWQRPPTTGSGICFDDLGAEVMVGKNFGNEAAPLVSVVLARYELLKTGLLNGQQTHFTTNLTRAEVAKYGPRFTDRIKEMCNVVSFPVDAPSRRR